MFPTPFGEIINYPKQHSSNLTTQHQATRNRLKPVIRIFKNMRNRWIRDGSLRDGIAPSYFIEGMLYNVPPLNFLRTYGDAFCNCVNWLSNTDRSTLVCPNRQYYLLGDSNIQWPARDFDAYLDALIHLWNSRQLRLTKSRRRHFILAGTITDPISPSRNKIHADCEFNSGLRLR